MLAALEMEEVSDIELLSHMTVNVCEERPLDKVMPAFLNVHRRALQVAIKGLLAVASDSGPVVSVSDLQISLVTVGGVNG